MKKSLVSLLVLGGLVGAYLYVQHIPQKGEPKARFSPIPHLKKDDIQKVEMTKEGEKVVLTRVGPETFKVTQPIDYPADKSSVKLMLEKLEKLQFGDMVTDKPEKHAEFEVTAEKGVRLAVYEKDNTDKPRADFWIGAMKDGYTLLRAEGHNEVVQVVGAIKSIFAKDLKGWRDKAILDFKREDANKIEVESPAGTYVLHAETAADEAKPNKKEKTTWKLDVTPMVVETLDDDVPSGIVTALYSLKAADFADGVKLADVGLEQPLWTITVSLTDQSKKQLLIGNKKDEQDTYVKVPDQAQVFLIKKYTLDRIARRPIDLRDKTVTSFKDDDVAEVEIVKDKSRLQLRKDNDSWKATPPTKLDDIKVKSAISALANMKATGFSEQRDPVKTGLGKPQGVVTVSLKDKSKIVLRVGSEAEDNAVYLAREGRPDIFLLKKYTAERFLKTATDLEKKETKN